MDLFGGGISLGRWAGIRVMLHWSFVLYAAMQIFGSRYPGHIALYMALLFGIVLLHEFGHCFACRAVQGRADHIILWPLGGLAMCLPPDRPWPQLATTAGGPMVNVLLIPVLWALRQYAVPALPGASMGAAYAWMMVEYAIEINALLLTFNLLPAYPMDGGRLLQEILWPILGYGRSLLVAGMVGTVAGVGFVVLGLGLHRVEIPAPWLDNHMILGERTDVMLIAIGVMVAMASFGAYRRAEEITRWRKN
jgi:Zn-dependent protease